MPKSKMTDTENLKVALSKHHLITKKPHIVNPERSEKQLVWPNSRTLSTINDLYKVKNPDLRTVISILPGSSKILDIGPGRGTFLKEVSESYREKQFKCYGITTTQVDEANLELAKELMYGAVPKSKNFLERHAREFDLVFDTYAALTYSDNPLHSLIYVALMMAPNGKLYSMSSLTPGDTENSCFGNSGTREKIKEFFIDEFGIKLEFELVQIKSQACKVGEYMDDLRVHFEVPKSGLKLKDELSTKTTWKLFAELCKRADSQIGVPVLMENKTAFKAGTYHITMRDYQLLPVHTFKQGG